MALRSVHPATLEISSDSLERVTAEVCRPLIRRAGWLWWTGMAISLLLLAVGGAAVYYQLTTGVGTWGLDRSVGWGLAITNFVFWIGIGHAGTFISAILYLLRQEWRSSISRLAEASTLLAVVCAAVFPVIHLGRPLLSFWMAPYPNWRGPLWINFRSPLVWDFFAIAAYLSLSIVFFYVGLIPDLARLRETGPRPTLFRWLSRGWSNSRENWSAYRSLYLVLASLATVLVISVHSIVSLDFAVTIVPGWHSTVFPPFFVVGALFSGFAMVTVLAIAVRRFHDLSHIITIDHLEKIARLTLAGSCFIGFIYGIELAHAWRSGEAIEQLVMHDRLAGAMRWPFMLMVLCNVAAPQILWWGRVRRNTAALTGVSILILSGMWLERYVIVVGSLQRDYLPANWTEYTPTLIEVATLAGSLGLFAGGFLLFCRLFPVLPIFEVKAQQGRSGDAPILGPQPAELSAKDESAESRHGGGRSLQLSATFDTEDRLLRAVGWARTKGWRVSGVESPFPVEELDQTPRGAAQRLPWLALVLVLSGGSLAFAFQSWTSGVDWPLNVGGRPFFSSPAFIPVTFEIAVLSAGIGAFAIFWTVHMRRRRSSRALDDSFRLRLDVRSNASNHDLEPLRDLATELEIEQRWES